MRVPLPGACLVSSTSALDREMAISGCLGVGTAKMYTRACKYLCFARRVTRNLGSLRLPVCRNTAPVRAKLCPLAFAGQTSPAGLADPWHGCFFPVTTLPAAPHSRVASAREADRAYAFPACIAKFDDIGAVLFEKFVALLGRELHAFTSPWNVIVRCNIVGR